VEGEVELRGEVGHEAMEYGLGWCCGIGGGGLGSGGEGEGEEEGDEEEGARRHGNTIALGGCGLT
jgi:hypothetical protein